MATIKCNKCNSGIHYHGEPSGIQYYFIKKTDWNNICSSHFDKNNKVFSENNIPKLFRSDTIEEDFSEQIITAWKCPHCKLFMFFNRNDEITNEFEPIKIDNTNIISASTDSQTDYIVFDDFTWDKLTERAIPNNEISSNLCHYYIAKINECSMEFYCQTGQITERYIKFI